MKIRPNVTLIFSDLQQVAERSCIKLVDKMPGQSTSITPVDNLHHTCYHQAVMQTHPDIGLIGNKPAADLLVGKSSS